MERLKKVLVRWTRRETTLLNCNATIMLKRGRCCPQFNCHGTVSLKVRFPFRISRRCYVITRLVPKTARGIGNVIYCPASFG